ncbi:subclass B1 metallo-beta-lactamase [Desertivirga xinjiangensis]|uniref:subclass B1 metallo-beta-lactamase n=1 Tax=Desertivirga xinjiangensis TaxID=539206 RepID=UPI003F6E88F4
MIRSFFTILISLGLLSKLSAETSDTLKGTDKPVYQSQTLSITQISPHVYLHTSFLQIESFGKVPCNGIIVVNGNQAVVFDSPADDVSAEELISFLTSKRKLDIIAVVATHFHADCVGGLKAFHDHNIRSYANSRTINILKTKEPQLTQPEYTFTDSLILKVGNLQVYAGFFGAGHTPDNVVGYFAADSVLFGGCLIKEQGAQKGNLNDADLKAWPSTVQKLKQRFPEVKIVVPGHGKPGGQNLLDYTIELFK